MIKFKTDRVEHDWHNSIHPVLKVTLTNLDVILSTLFGYNITLTSIIRTDSKNHKNGLSVDIRIRDMLPSVLGYVMHYLSSFIDLKVLYHRGTAYHIHLQHDDSIGGKINEN